MSEERETHGLTIRQLVLEMREDIKQLSAAISHLENNAVTRQELNMWRQAQKTTRRWAVTTILSLAVLGMIVLAAVVRTG